MPHSARASSAGHGFLLHALDPVGEHLRTFGELGGLLAQQAGWGPSPSWFKASVGMNRALRTIDKRRK